MLRASLTPACSLAILPCGDRIHHKNNTTPSQVDHPMVYALGGLALLRESMYVCMYVRMYVCMYVLFCSVLLCMGVKTSYPLNLAAKLSRIKSPRRLRLQRSSSKYAQETVFVAQNFECTAWVDHIYIYICVFVLLLLFPIQW